VSPPRRTSARLPVHLVVIGGLTTAAYAISLAAVTSLQVAGDRALIAARDPVRQAIGRLSRSYDHLESAVASSRGRYMSAADRYGDVSGAAGDLQLELEALAEMIGEIEGSVASVPTRLSLPAVPQAAPGPAGQPPKSHARTGASGGG
jgi:hypothetical protein